MYYADPVGKQHFIGIARPGPPGIVEPYPDFFAGLARLCRQTSTTLERNQSRQPFDPKKVAKPRTRDPLSRRNIGGLGIFFMHKMMDRVKFDFSSGNGNRLTMVKKIKK